jgi:hypothetical protein
MSKAFESYQFLSCRFFTRLRCHETTILERYYIFVSGRSRSAGTKSFNKTVQFFIAWPTSFKNVSFITLWAFHKKDGGIRPIAIGNCLRRLTSKLAFFQSRNSVNSYLSPHQLGVATKLGCEAAIHTTRTFVNNDQNRI